MMDLARKRANGLAVEIAVVLSVSFSMPLVVSVLALADVSDSWRYQFSWTYGTAVRDMLLGLLVTWFALYQRGEGLASLGLAFGMRTLGASVLLFMVLYSVQVVSHGACGALLGSVEAGNVATRTVASLGAVPLALAVAVALSAGVCEEVVGRAYLITRVEQLGCGKPLAIGLSTLLLASCHLHQGVTVAAGNIPAFLILALYYVRYRDATALILAHILYNGAAFYSGVDVSL